MKALKSGSVSQADVDRAKSQLKVTIFSELGTSSGRFEDLVAQALRGEIQGKSELIAAIDAISVSDVNAVSKFYSFRKCQYLFLLFSKFDFMCLQFIRLQLFLGGEKSCIR